MNRIENRKNDEFSKIIPEYNTDLHKVGMKPFSPLLTITTSPKMIIVEGPFSEKHLCALHLSRIIVKMEIPLILSWRGNDKKSLDICPKYHEPFHKYYPAVLGDLKCHYPI